VKLVIIHYHLRPGGIRRVIELGTPCVVQALGKSVEEVTLLIGEADDLDWNRRFIHSLGGLKTQIRVEKAFGYLADWEGPPGRIRARVAGALRSVIQPGNGQCLVWAHNLGIGRNPIMSRELARYCEDSSTRLVSHHHDLWFDNRWLRWREMRRFGIRTLAAAARAVFFPNRRAIHVAINRADLRVLGRRRGIHTAWLPNMAQTVAAPSSRGARKAGRWLAGHLAQRAAPVWLLPCRLLRRKNVAEAVLLARWLRPEAWVVTTGRASSSDEQDYADRLNDGARRHHWRLRLSVLEGDEADKPGVPDLMGAAEVILLTSIQEGFGLPYIEAAATGRPLIARELPNVLPDLRQFGFRCSQSYSDLQIDPRLFDWKAEIIRQNALFEEWCRCLPTSCRAWVGRPRLLDSKTAFPIAFSRMTLTAQLEVLAEPAAESWQLCVPLNRFLVDWRSRAASGSLSRASWPRRASRCLSGRAYGERFARMLRRNGASAERQASPARIQEDFIRERLSAGHLFPLLWSTRS
jgi:glycosyltransferase involved in cell wall biosynthesis